MILNRKSQSEIISTILLILVVVTAGAIISSFVIDYINKNLDDTKCVDYAGKIEIKNNPDYTCYDLANNQLRVQIGFGNFDKALYGFKIRLIGQGSDIKSVYIYEGTPDNETVSVYLSSPKILRVPKNNEDITYVIEGVTRNPDMIKINPIREGKKECSEDAGSIINSIGNCTAGP
jgi:flagellin-like protein